MFVVTKPPSKITNDDVQCFVTNLKLHLINVYDYNDQSALDVINHVAAALARGESYDQ